MNIKNISIDEIEVENFWDEILSENTEVELDIDYINKAQKEARHKVREVKINCLMEKLISEIIADVVEEELKKAGL